ncbi:MAG TPA: hypothetical protein VLU38_06140 [Methanomassiliicoccales archaeon]|nr:hypothetical protein [Methanomassiliicoccales archaeon]
MPRPSKARVPDEEQVRRTLQKLQEGYLKRNLASLDYYVKELFPPDGKVTLIGTSGMLPEDGEWPRNREGAKKVLESDWRNWGDVYFNVASANVVVVGDVGWVESNGFVEKVLPDQQVCENHLKYVKAVVDGDLSAKEKVAEIARGASNVVMEMMLGERYVWPMRFSAVLQRIEGRWLFRQLHFSFPTTRFPDERLVGLEAPRDDGG